MSPRPEKFVHAMIFTHVRGFAKGTNHSQSYSRRIRQPRDNDWMNASPEERTEAGWTSTKFIWPGPKLQQVNPDFKQLLLEFNAHRVEYLIVGSCFGSARVCPCDERHGCLGAAWRSNAEKVMRALSDFGVPLTDLTVNDLSRKETMFQIGLPPLLSTY